MITKLAFSGYRSLRDIVIPLMPLNVITGANGCGKSNLYKALRLLADIGQGHVVRSIASEGGLPSTLWAGPERFSRGVKDGTYKIEGTARTQPVSLRLGFGGTEYGYAIDLGLPPPSPTVFNLDPEIKGEYIWTGDTLSRANMFVERKGPGIRVRKDKGGWTSVYQTMPPFDSMMTHYIDPVEAPEILMLREHMKGWRFYDHFRSDRGSPARRPQIGTFTPVLAHDGSDFAAAIQTICEIGDYEAMQTAVDNAFPGSSVLVACQDGYFEIEMEQKGILRPLKAAELSDGTLRYLLWVAALLTPRPPGLLVLNEPETSLHPNLLAPLADLIAQAAKNSQVIIVSHAAPLVNALLENSSCYGIELEKELGETKVKDDDFRPGWKWPKR